MDSPRWLIDVLLRPDLAGLEELLSEGVRFRSPYAEYEGRDDVGHLVRLIAQALSHLRVVGIDGADTPPMGHSERTTRMTAKVGDHELQGVLCEDLDAAGRLAEATLMLRPYVALGFALSAMSDLLAESPLPSRSI
ncbi:nuclear transport factor 2 family protein [Aeromicrobium sp.]|uniref:nuclear transport factor 2 family protein n=1 Tax=Aeromicrobium sp. TaxID=1871063 RepID=UPI0030BE0764